MRVFRAQGADNVTWLWTINTSLPRSGPVSRWWPGQHAGLYHQDWRIGGGTQAAAAFRRGTRALTLARP